MINQMPEGMRQMAEATAGLINECHLALDAIEALIDQELRAA